MYRNLALLLAATVSTASALGQSPAPPPAPELEPGTRLAEKIVNGVPEWGFPSVVALVNPQDGQSFCTGTLIGCQTVLTAAHCFCTVGNDTLPGSVCAQVPELVDPANVKVFSQHTGFHAVTAVAIHPDFAFEVQQDLAILHLAEPVAGIEPSLINGFGPVPYGTPGWISGFGLPVNLPGARTGLKGSGRVSTRPCMGVPDASHLCWSFAEPVGPPGADSNTCQGDSGGPLFAPTADGLVLVGVTSGGSSLTCLPNDNSFDADVFFGLDWILDQGGPDVGSTLCGSLPPAGSGRAPSLAGAGSLSPANPSDRYTFTVPSGTLALGVGLNGEGDVQTGDFDLHVRPVSGGPGFVCESELPGPFEFCPITNPAAGTWEAVVDRFRGDGAYQLTVTPFRSSGPTGPGCTPDPMTLCLNGGRFKVQVSWQNSQGETGFGQATPLTADTGYFWFFQSTNVEMVVKILDACPLNGHFWVFAAGLTDVQAVLTITDSETGAVRTYVNDPGVAFQPIQDTAAFPTCP